MAKLILTNEVAGLGSAGDVVEVRSGYARNYLIPQGYATAWTRGGAKQVESIQAAQGARHPRPRRGRGAQGRDRGPEGPPDGQGRHRRTSVRLVKTDHVAEAVAASGLGSIDKRKVTITWPIKSTGDHEATVRLHEDVVAVITLQVVAAK